MEEYLDIYDCDGQHIGVKSRSECHKPNPGYYHKSVWVWVVNDNDEILLQRRAYTKKELPGVWAMPVAGHISAGESPLVTCVREAKEELGLDTSEKDYEFVQEYFHEEGWEYAQAYILRNNTTIEKMVFQEEEVAEAKWISYQEFLENIYRNDYVPGNKAFKDWCVKILKPKK